SGGGETKVGTGGLKERGGGLPAGGGQRKERTLKSTPACTVTIHHGPRWITVEGKARLRTWDDTDPETMRRLLREIYVAAGGTHDDWETYDRVMREERRAAVVIVPERIYARLPRYPERRTRMTSFPPREAAWALLCEYTQSDSLRKHALGVEAVMRAYAYHYGGDADRWGMVGLLHDFDYERYPTMEDHPLKGSEILKEQGYPDDIRYAILCHAPYLGYERQNLMDKAILAV